MLKDEQVTPTVSVSNRSGTCPTCHHSYEDAEAWGDDPEAGLDRLLRKLFRRPPAPAKCPVGEYDTSGQSEIRCDCTDPFHGS